MSKYHQMDRKAAEFLATTIREQFTRFSLNQGSLVDLLCQVSVPHLDGPFKRRRYEIPRNHFVPTHEEIEEKRIDPFTVLSLDLIIYNRETPARNHILNRLVKGIKEKIAGKREKPIDAYVFYRHAVKDPFISQYMKTASQVTAPYSVSGRLVEKKEIYLDGAPMNVTLPMLFIPITAKEEQSYIQAFEKAHQFPHDEIIREEIVRHQPKLSD